MDSSGRYGFGMLKALWIRSVNILWIRNMAFVNLSVDVDYSLESA